MQTENASLATVSPVASAETSALVAPRFTIATGAELAEGNTSKRAYVLGRVAAGAEKKLAVAEFEAALADKRALLTASTCAILTSPNVAVERRKRTATGWDVRITDLTAKRAAAADKTADRIAKLEARIAELKAKASA